MNAPPDPKAIQEALRLEKADNHIDAMDIYEDLNRRGWATAAHLTALGNCYVKNRQRQDAQRVWMHALELNAEHQPAIEALDRYFPKWRKKTKSKAQSPGGLTIETTSSQPATVAPEKASKQDSIVIETAPPKPRQPQPTPPTEAAPPSPPKPQPVKEAPPVIRPGGEQPVEEQRIPVEAPRQVAGATPAPDAGSQFAQEILAEYAREPTAAPAANAASPMPAQQNADIGEVRVNWSYVMEDVAEFNQIS